MLVILLIAAWFAVAVPVAATRHVIEAHVVAHLGVRGVLADDSTEAIKAADR